MALIENTLFGERDLVKMAIARLKEFEPKEGYYLAFSGGKDSCVIKALSDMAGVKYDAHFNVSTVDAPEMLKFIKEKYPGVEWSYPPMTMWQMIEKKRMPPSRIVRYCCEIIKEKSGPHRVIITGVRWAESARRSKRRMVEACMKDKSKTYLNPIIDWEHSDVWDFIKQESVPYCSLYDEGFDRLGCIGCPMSGKKRVREFERWPRIKAMYIKAFQRAVDKRKRDAIEKDGLTYKGEHQKWASGEDMFDWWMEERRTEETDGGMFT